jgi:hypothetical protein
VFTPGPPARPACHPTWNEEPPYECHRNSRPALALRHDDGSTRVAIAVVAAACGHAMLVVRSGGNSSFLPPPTARDDGGCGRQIFRIEIVIVVVVVRR